MQDLPLNLVVSPSKKYLAVTNNGQSTQSITLIDAATETVLDDETIAKSWLGLAFSPDEKYLYASAGNDNKINIYKIENNQLQKDGEIVLDKPWPVKVSPAGLCATEKHIFVVAKDNNTLYQLDIASKSILKKIPLAAEAYTCILSSDKNLLYISLWGGAKVLIYDIAAQGNIGGDARPPCFAVEHLACEAGRKCRLHLTSGQGEHGTRQGAADIQILVQAARQIGG